MNPPPPPPPPPPVPGAPETKSHWWKNRWMKLPVWAWIAVGVLGMGAVGNALEKPAEEKTAVATSDSVGGTVATSAATTVPEATTTGVPATLPPTTAPPVAVPSPTTTAPPVTVPSPTTTANVNPLGGNSPEDFLMPSVVCMNLQEAQDEIQDHGVFYSRSEDATGQGRMQMNDSNWLVVNQDPAPGTPIGEGDALLYVVKYGEQPNPCA